MKELCIGLYFQLCQGTRKCTFKLDALSLFKNANLGDRISFLQC